MKTVRKSAFGVQRRNLAVAGAAGTAAREEEDGKKIARRIDRLERTIQQFYIDGQRFLAGDLPVPPDSLGDRIQAELRRLRSANLKSAAADFRLNGLEARFNSYRELLGRRLRSREQGALRQKPVEEPVPDPVRGVVVGRHADPASAKVLYQGLHAASGKPKMTLERFRNYLDRQSAMIRQKTGCSEIQFRVAVENGKMKLKAKPIRQSGS